VRKTKARSASARRQVRKAKISTTAPKAFTATAMCTSVIGRSLPEPSSQDNGSKAGSPSNVGRHVSQASHLGMSPCRKSPGYSTSKLAICSVEGLSARLWPADWVPAATAGVGRSLRARCQPMQCRGFAARGDHGGSQKCHRSDNPCAAAPHRGPPDLTRAKRRALLSLVARRES